VAKTNIEHDAVKERGIHFSAPMVRCLLAGTKTQTRRVIAKQPTSQPFPSTLDSRRWHYRDGYEGAGPSVFDPSVLCPYGARGDRLWVRETWCNGHGLACVESTEATMAPVGAPLAPSVVYRADAAQLPGGCKWRSPLSMPRWASRITLEVTGVRVQRLQDISDADIASEGVCAYVGAMVVNGEPATGFMSAQRYFAAAWNTINEKRPGCTWSDNPWVWVLEFKRVADAARGAA
jgi:hypothetical protein